MEDALDNSCSEGSFEALAATGEGGSDAKCGMELESSGNVTKEEAALSPEGAAAPMVDLEMSLERLLQRQKSELMFELRRLQYGDRPVTGQQDRRRTVENLVLRAVGTDRHQTVRAAVQSTGTDDHIISSPSTMESHRPEHILVEVNALVERRPVSSMLQSLSFRRSLESSVRNALQTMRSFPSQGRAPVLPQAPVASSRATNNVTASFDREPLTGWRVAEVERSPSSLSLRSESLPASISATEAGAAAPPPPPPPPPPLAVEAPDAGDGTTRAEEWVDQHVPLHTGPVAGRQMRTQEFLEQMQQEEFVVEISDLIHRQLVTSTLNGRFRQVLERMMRTRMDESGFDGTRVQEQLRQLPRSSVHMRNDFPHLGIMPAAVAEAGDQMDNMSVISATAAVALPHAYAQGNATLSREIQSLRSEIQELKNMMRSSAPQLMSREIHTLRSELPQLKNMIKLSFDLQLDIQRSIRQEVSAALAQTLGGASAQNFSSSTADHPQAAAANGQCLVCLDKQADTVLYRCGHLCLCYACAMQLHSNGAHCPVCRAPINDILKTYRP